MGPWSGIFNTGFIYDILIAAIPALICVTVHELSHGYIAYRLGDNTAKSAGRLTLNPIKHIDIIGLAMIVLVGFGWAKPVPVNMNNFKNPKRGMALTALAGPASNLILASIVMLIFMRLPFPYGGFEAFIYAFYNNSFDLPVITLILHRLIYLNVFLALFNLLPIPPLDGSKILFSFLPQRIYYKLMVYERFGMIFLIILIFSGRFLPFDIFGIVVTGPALSLLVFMAQTASSIFG